jgi:hypothetical protein
MATKEDIGWGEYDEYEGPFYRGKHRFELPEMPTDDELILDVITATEGGRYDAFNGYDSCDASSGLIQFCEHLQYSVSAMLGSVHVWGQDLLKPVHDYARHTGMVFKKNHQGMWRFFYRRCNGEVNTEALQDRMFHLNSSGKKGTWDDASKSHAKGWAAAISSVWEQPEAQKAQRGFTIPMLHNFAFGDSKRILQNLPDTDLAKAFEAAYLSYAINNPSRAAEWLAYTMETSPHPTFGMSWFIDVLRNLTFGPKISIYPHRYDAIRAKLEKHYRTDLPDFASELATWKAETGHEHFYDTTEVQDALIVLGYDLGPWGTDNKYGPKTTAAVKKFETDNGLEPDGIMDPVTATKMKEVLIAEGLEYLLED